MKITMVYLFVFIFCLFFLLNCSKDSDHSMEQIGMLTTCYKFIERGTNTPIEGLSVLIHSTRPIGVDLGNQGTTDSNGEFCFEHNNPLGSITYFRFGYAGGDCCMISHLAGAPFKIDVPDPYSSVIELDPISFIKFNVKKNETTTENDKIGISHAFESKGNSSSSHYIFFNADIIDTVFVANTRALDNKIEWEFLNDNGVLKSGSKDISIIKGDTLYFAIEY